MAGDQAELTPIHIRGKRNAPPRVKTRRQQTPRQPPTESLPSQLPMKNRQVKLSRLEDLPTEVLEVIFLYSGNVDLPLTSKGLLAQLSSQRLHRQIMDALLRPMLGADMPSEAQICRFETVTPRRFCTWDLFRSCFPDVVKPDLHRFIRVPSKLLHGPWTGDKIAFLRWHLPGEGVWPDATELLRMQSFDGILDSIKEQVADALGTLLDIGLDIPVQAYYAAVIEYGCNRDIVSMLFRRSLKDDALDPLDPVLWAWSTEPAQKANGNGAFLQELLSDYGGWIARQRTL